MEEVNEADLLLHVIDASHPAWEEQRLVVDQVLAELGAKEKPVLYVFSKIDAIPQAELVALQERIGNLLPKVSVFVSSVTSGGLEPLRRALQVAAREGTAIAELRLSSGDGKLLAQIYREADVLGQTTSDGVTVLKARLPQPVAARLAKAGVKITLS